MYKRQVGYTASNMVGNGYRADYDDDDYDYEWDNYNYIPQTSKSSSINTRIVELEAEIDELEIEIHQLKQIEQQCYLTGDDEAGAEYTGDIAALEHDRAALEARLQNVLMLA